MRIASKGVGRYAIALGGNRRTRHGDPAATLRAGLAALSGADVAVLALSPILVTVPLGPGTRRYANAVALIESDCPPLALLARVKAIERAFGRRRGKRWGDRPLDIDLLLWSGGRWASRDLVIPHAGLAGRRFVLGPLDAVAPGWRLPGGVLAVRHLNARLTRPKPLA